MGSGGLAGARSAVDQLVRAGLAGMGPDDLREHLRGVSGLISSLELVRARVVRELEKLDAPSMTGAASMVDFVSLECGLMSEAAKDRVVLGRQLESLSGTAQALASGALSLDTAALVARSAAAVAPGYAAEVEAHVLDAALTMAPGNLRRVAEQVKAHVDRESFEDAAQRAYRNRSLRIGPMRDGLYPVSGALTPVAVETLKAGMQAHLKPRDRDDDRSYEQRCHDALEMALRQGGKVHLQVVAPVETMVGTGDAPALLQGLIPLSREDTQRLLADDADVSSVLRDAKGNVVRVSRARNLGPAQRRAMVALHPTCAAPGCTRAAVQSQAHHTEEYAISGHSGLAFEGPLCGPHQERVHRDGFYLKKLDNGEYVWLPPGHPDNPVGRLTPAEYREGRRRAIDRRIARSRTAATRAGARAAPS